jgi:UDP-N-acetylmuramoyl-L-alanyl-D-glutamate--2,6-diaminopimelate ligase
MHLHTLLAALEQPPLNKYGFEALKNDIEVTSLAYDSRKVKAGGLFIAVPGTHTDGRRFLEDAFQKGAVVALGEVIKDYQHLPLPYIEVQNVRTALANVACAFYEYPAQRLCTIGITGTDGKTTTSNLISAILDSAGRRNGLMTTVNFKISGQEWENSTRQSTLEALEIQQFLRETLDAGVDYAVIESTSHGLELQRVYGCAFDIGPTLHMNTWTSIRLLKLTGVPKHDFSKCSTRTEIKDWEATQWQFLTATM